MLLPDQACLTLDRLGVCLGVRRDDVATAMSAIEQRNGDVLTSQEVL